MNAEALKTKTLKHLHDSLQNRYIFTTTSRAVKIETTFLDARNDIIELFLYETSTGYTLSDNLHTVNEFTMIGFDFKKIKEAREEFYQSLQTFGVVYDEETGGLTKEFSMIENIIPALDELIQCIQRISGLPDKYEEN